MTITKEDLQIILAALYSSNHALQMEAIYRIEAMLREMK